MLLHAVNSLVNDYRNHPIKTVAGLIGAVVALNCIGLGSCNVWRNYHNKSSYTETSYLIHADSHSQSEIHYANKHDSNNFYKEQHKQAVQMRQAHIEKVTSNLNKIGLKHGVTKITYNPKNHHFNVRFNSPTPTNYQRKYAQKLCNTAND